MTSRAPRTIPAPKSIENLSDLELCRLLLGRGASREALARLCDWAGDASGIARLSSAALSLHVGPAPARRLAAALELGRRAVLAGGATEREVFDEPERVFRWARPRLAHLDHEEVWLLSLDGGNGLRSARRVAQGGAHGCALTARDILAPALRDGATSIVLVHNHPSGCPEPSVEDVAMTRAVAAACTVVGVSLLDHVVVARGGATSLSALGALEAADCPASALAV